MLLELLEGSQYLTAYFGGNSYVVTPFVWTIGVGGS